jgi:hypothetical protein
MANVQSRIEQFWNSLGLLVCLAAAADVAYWRRNVWEMLLFPLLMVVAGNLFARLVGIAHSGPVAPDTTRTGSREAR